LIYNSIIINIILIEMNYVLASNKFRKKLQDKTVLEREEILLEVEMLEKKAPVKWYKNGEEIRPNERSILIINFTLKLLEFIS